MAQIFAIGQLIWMHQGCVGGPGPVGAQFLGQMAQDRRLKGGQRFQRLGQKSIGAGLQRLAFGHGPFGARCAKQHRHPRASRHSGCGSGRGPSRRAARYRRCTPTGGRRSNAVQPRPGCRPGGCARPDRRHNRRKRLRRKAAVFDDQNRQAQKRTFRGRAGAKTQVFGVGVIHGRHPGLILCPIRDRQG